MPDSTVIYSLLSAVLAHGAGLGTNSCMPCLTSLLFTLSICCNSSCAWKNPWPRRVNAKACDWWKSCEHCLCPKPGNPAHPDLYLPVDVDIVPDRVGVLLTSHLTATKPHPVYFCHGLSLLHLSSGAQTQSFCSSLKVNRLVSEIVFGCQKPVHSSSRQCSMG